MPTKRWSWVVLATLIVFTFVLALPAMAAPTVPLNDAHVGATNPGFQAESCPTPPEGQEGWWGWHFIMPANHNFTSLSVTFQYAGTFSANPFPGGVFDPDPDNSHAYIWTPGPDRLLAGEATSDDNNAFFNLSHVCGGTSEWKDLEVIKEANTTYDRTYDWTIEKSGDKENLTLAVGQAFNVNYEVTVDVASYTDSNWAVAGEIFITNPNNPGQAYIESVSDVISPDIAIDVDCGVEFPYTLGPGELLTCTYGSPLPDGSTRLNTATVATVPDTIDGIGGGEGTADVVFGDTPTNEIDECVDVTDSLYGALGQVCVGDAPATFEYTWTVGPYDVCGEYTVDNTASFVANDTGATGSSSWTVAVNVPCGGGCTLTQGYWKTHSEFGPAPYDDNWANLPNGASTPFFLSGQTYYEVLWTPPAGNPYYTLAHQWIAAYLNVLNGASIPADVQSAWNSAKTLFETYTPAQVAASRTLQRNFRQYVGILDQYNNGYIGPGHCSEQYSETSQPTTNITEKLLPQPVLLPGNQG